jgi:SAM-dependent methyltransferase
MTVKALGESVFHYQDYTVYRFIHYFQQIHHVLNLEPKKILEIGPGDHTVTDFLRRKGGVVVKTFDNDPNLFPDYLGDIREELKINERFDLVLASEVFEHMNIKWLPIILENIKNVLVDGGYLVVSLPYSTIRLFPERRNVIAQ